MTRPVKQLAGFARLGLRPGETRRVEFQLDLTQLAFHDARMRLVVEPGEVEVMVGASSADLRLEGGFTITGTRREVQPRRDRPHGGARELSERLGVPIPSRAAHAGAPVRRSRSAPARKGAI